MRRLTAFAIVLSLTALAAAQDKAPKGTLTKDNLKSVLDDMGLKPTEVYKGLCTVKIDRDNYQATYRLYPSGDGRLLFLGVRRSNIYRPGEMPAKFWRGLLAANDTLSASQTAWSYNKSERALELIRYVPNQGLTPVALRKHLNDFHAVVKKNNPTWQEKEPELAPIKDTEEQAKERGRLKGRWVAVEVVMRGTKLDPALVKKETKGKDIAITFDDTGGVFQLVAAEKFLLRLGPTAGLMSLYAGETRSLTPIRYLLNKDELTICLDPAGLTHPPALESSAVNGFNLLKFKRAKE